MKAYYKGIFRDGSGNPVASGTASIYLAGTTTAASVYTSLTGATAVNSVTSSTDGTFEFWVDRLEYADDQKFKVVISKTGYTTATWDNVIVDQLVIGSYSITTPRTLSAGVHTIPYGITIALSSTGVLNCTSDNTTLCGGGSITQAASNVGAIAVAASSVTIDGLTITGPQHATSKTSENGVYAYGADASNYISGLTVKNCEITNWGQYGIKMNFVEQFDVSDGNYIHAVYQAGIGGLSVKEGKIQKNTISDIDSTAGGGKYGIILSRTDDDSIVTYPRTTDVIISGNIVKDISTWEGIDTHGGERITISGNQVYGCFIGINASSASNTAGTGTWGPRSVNVFGNIIDSGVSDGSMHTGIIFGGNATEAGTGAVNDNIVIGYGSDGAGGNGGAIFYQYTDGLSVQGNVIRNASWAGIRANLSNYGQRVAGNTITDVWADTAARSVGIKIDSTDNTGLIDGNIFRRTGAFVAKAHDYDSAIDVDSASGNFMQIGQNYSYGIASYLYDPGNLTGRGEFASNTDTSGTGEDTLKSVVLPDDTISTGRKITVVGRGIKIGANDNKTIKFYINTTAYTVIPAANDQYAWEARISILVDATDSQRVGMVGSSGTAIVYNAFADAAEDFAGGAVTLKFTGECANAGDTVRQYAMDVRIE